MKKLSLTAKLALWYAFFMCITILITWLLFTKSADRITRSYYRNTLESAVTVAFASLSYENGMFDFPALPEKMESIHLSFFDENGSLIYGHICADTPLSPGTHTYAYDEYGRHRAVYDSAFELDGFGTVIARVSMNISSADSILTRVMTMLYVLLPAIMLLSLIGGRIIAARALKPVGNIARTAESIAGANDLKKRIPSSDADDELASLINVINNMLSRLDSAFERETRITSDISHELRTPVAAILAQSEMALLETATKDEKEAALQKINAKSRDLTKMIQNLLLLFRMDAKRVALQFEETDLADIADAVLSEAEERCAAKRIKLEKSFEPAAVSCDALMIAGLIRNLTENACRYTPEGGSILSSVSVENGRAVFRITNTGVSLSEEAVSHIFERFYTASDARTDGSGLGLAIAKAISDAHGASLGCESDNGKMEAK